MINTLTVIEEALNTNFQVNQELTDSEVKLFCKEINQLLWQTYPVYNCFFEKEFWQSFFRNRSILLASITWGFMLVFGKLQGIQESFYYYLINLPFLLPFAVAFYGWIEIYVHQKWVEILKEAWLLSSDRCPLNKSN